MSWKSSVESTVNSGENRVVELNLKSRSVAYSNTIKCHRDIKEITGDEEVARAFLVDRLVRVLEYKPEMIELEKEYAAGRKPKLTPRIDLILKDSTGNPFFFIECKDPAKYEAERLHSIRQQLFGLAPLEQGQTGKKVKYLVYYTVESRGDPVRDRAIIIDYVKYPTFDSWNEAGQPSFGDSLPGQFNQPQKTPLTRGGKRDLRKEFDQKEIKALATELHDVLWGGGGTGDTEVFSSLVNVILAKIQDEYSTKDNEEYSFQVRKYGDEIEPEQKLFQRINGLYRDALREQLNKGAGDLSDQFVVNTQKFPINKLIYTVQKLEDYSFVDGKNSLGGKDILGDFFEQIQREGFKQTKGQFFTPLNIVRFLLYALEIDNLAIERLNRDKELPYLIDPACGSGTFLIEAMKIITQELKYHRRNDIQRNRGVQDKFEDFFLPDQKEHRWAKDFIYAIEHNFDLGTATKVNMILHGDGSTNVFVKDGLLPFRFYEKSTAPNYLNGNKPDPLYGNKEVNGSFDVVVTNPPFSVNLDNRTKDHLHNGFLFHDKRNSENLFIERYYQVLREGGRLGVVLPESVFDTTENKCIRLFLYKYFKICAVVSLPQVTFDPYTKTKTSLLFAKKKTRTEVEKWNELWSKYSTEWGKLTTRAENYRKVFIDGQAETKYPSIKGHDDVTIRKNLSRLLKIDFSADEEKLTIAQLLETYSAEIADESSADTDATGGFGRVNVNWVIGKVAEEVKYDVFLAEAENVGYKRTKRGELEKPNDLFDIETAPNNLDLAALQKVYDEELTLAGERKTKLVAELSKAPKDDKRKLILGARLKAINAHLVALAKERDSVLKTLGKYYNEKGDIRPDFATRLDTALLKLFRLERVARFKSSRVLVRTRDHKTILDHLRSKNIWA